MNDKASISEVIATVVLYIVLMIAFHWIGEKLFYNFTEVGLLILDGQIFKFLCTLAIMFVGYFIIAGIAFHGKGSAKISGTIVLLVLVCLTGSDLYDIYQHSSGIFEITAATISYVIAFSSDIMRMITIGIVLKQY